MTSTPIEIGTLIVVILKAKNLPNKRHIGKQDPYCSVKFHNETRRTRAIRRGGQHPEWDEEIRFTIFEDVEDEVARTATGGEDEPPPPPPKKDKKKIKSVKIMQLMCYADDPREPDLIGETNVDLTEVLTKGETDEWFTLRNKDKYCGEVYLELTFWSNETPPEKRTTPRPSSFHPQYGGPGSFTPSTDLPAVLKNGGGNQQTPSPSRLSNGGSDFSLPPSLRPSGSLAKLNLYNAPYEQQSRYGDTLDQLSNGMTSLDVDGSRRRESFPPAPSEFGYAGTMSLHHSGSFSSLSSGSLSSAHSQGSLGGQSYHRNSLSSLPEPFAQDDYAPGHSRILLPVSETYHPELSYLYSHASSGFVAPPSSHTPITSQLGPTPPGSHLLSSGFASPQPVTPTMGPRSPQPPQQQYSIPSHSLFHPPHPHPPASAPPMQYPDPLLPPPSVPPVSHSAPPQQYAPNGTPSPPHHNHPGLPPPNAYQPLQPSNVPGSRPLPNPQYQSSPGFVTPSSGPTQSISPGNIIFPNVTPYQSPGPLPPRRRSSLPPTPSSTPSVSFVPPPPPPLLQTHLTQQGSHINPPPPPPPLPSQSYDIQSSQSTHGQQVSLPQPSHSSQTFGNFPPPPPPPSMSNFSSPSQAPPPPSSYSTPPQMQQPYYPPPPPLLPSQYPLGSSWNLPPPPPPPQHDEWH